MTSTIEGIVLNKENRAENFLSFTLFSKELGICYAMIKASKNKHTPLPDLFNEISIEVNKANFANNFFIKSINSIEIINNFSKNYRAFLEATKLAECLIKNLRHLEDFSQIYEDFSLALQAYINTKDARIVNIKWLYKFTKREGYAIREDFAANLSYNNQEVFVNIIKTPSSQCEVDEQALEFIYEKLNIWINSETDIIYR